MPTPTLSGTTLLNLGPLTTIWTAPASCATSTPTPALARKFDPGVAYWQQTCEVDRDPYDDCIPSGDAMNSEYHARQTSTERFLFHFSPGSQCPSGWVTAGYGIRDETSSHSLSGVFDDPTLTFDAGTRTSVASEINSTFELRADLFMSAMEPSETVIACCPSGYTAGLYGNCYSSTAREAYTASTGCKLYNVNDVEVVDRTFTFHGRVVTGSSISIKGSVVSLQPKTVTIEAKDSTSYVGALITPAITLVNRDPSGDVVQTSAAGSGETSSTGPNETPSSEVPSRAAGSSMVNSVMMAVWGVAVMAGAALMVPL
ncbi:hypothetical protein HER10_EVM0002386 [Colletotrichum scovillei]|uniref:LPxTG-domain-containing protein n=1 Tax=Colletotrichum scovillei TaxID=1209932 RepID=A0A9P7R5U5_9PEZI|nr:uncharacterized protein HER10_EVM0002386 [Colletotrichum scovillei]KAF4773608.1 hypothetical protein HER10_EVM0002386 [Colletotrichum scovillei]KAG7048361.1 LPxTG-domain-containing protein [Colletotrichum scovillei]KAG7065525.1 LPxTG-domain-containing protein [Colletotrichum scovillei]KAG7068129.1 LPxTG-domain-containing protein [Colletotrichum scovillei]